MKNLLFIPVLMLAVLFMGVQDVSAQATIKNGTTCTYAVDVFTGSGGSCAVATFFTVICPPMVATNVPLPLGSYVVAYRGYEVAPGPVCGAFKVGRLCAGVPNTYSYSCTCTATATFYPTTLGDMKIQ